MRLDRLLAEQLRLSRAQVRRLLARGAVQVDGRPVAEAAKGAAVAVGAKIEIAAFTRPADERVVAADHPLSILAEGSGWLAVDKPAGMPVHPLRPAETDTVLNAVAARHPEIHGVGEAGLRSGVVHRLDVDTSGALILATRQPAWLELREAFRAHRVDKRYRAIVAGDVEGEGSVAVGLVTARHRPAVVRVVDDAERERSRGVRIAPLSWRSLQRFGTASLLEVRPETGHLHQIRVTLAHLGFPVVGDRTYGRGDPFDAPRHMLHAARVAVDDIDASSPDPADFTALLEGLRVGSRTP